MRMSLFSLCAAVGLAGCAVGPEYRAPEFAAPAAYRTQSPQPASSDALWWRGFEDQTLNALVGKALDDNLDVAVALARLGEAQAFIRAERSDLAPTFDAGASANTQTDFRGATNDGAEIGGFLSFTPDLFGGQRRRIQNAVALADAEAFSVEDVRRITAASVASLYIEFRRAEARLALLDQSLELQNQTLEIVKARQSAGLSPDLDVRRAAADLAGTRAQRGGLETARVRAENALAVLIGEYAVSDLISTDQIPSFAGGPPIAAPADLLRRRADLRAAEAALVAATAAIGIEKADLYPRLQLPAQITADATSANIGDSLIGLVAANLDIPLFDAGRRRAEVAAAEYRADIALNEYKQSLLRAVSETETALASVQNTADQRAELKNAVDESARAYGQINSLYKEGLATFIDILDTQRTLISSRQSYVDSQADLAASFVDLHLAVGAPTVAHERGLEGGREEGID